MCVEKLAGIKSIISGILWIMISESVLLVQGGMTSLETHLESESFQDMSQDSIFGSKEEHGLRNTYGAIWGDIAHSTPGSRILGSLLFGT